MGPLGNEFVQDKTPEISTNGFVEELRCENRDLTWQTL